MLQKAYSVDFRFYMKAALANLAWSHVYLIVKGIDLVSLEQQLTSNMEAITHLF